MNGGGRLLTLRIVAALLLATAAACSSPSPEEELARAVERTVTDSFAFRLAVAAEDDPDGSDGVAGDLARLLDTAEITGRRHDGALAVRATVLGIDAAEVRVLPGEQTYVRAAFDVLGPLVGTPDPAALATVLREQEVAPEALTAVTTLFTGGWVGVVGGLDPGMVDDLRTGPGEPSPRRPPSRTQLEEMLGGDVRGFVGRYVDVTSVRDMDDSRHFAVDVDIGALVRRLARADARDADAVTVPSAAVTPSPLSGTVAVRDGRVERVSVDLDVLAASPGDAPLRDLDLVLAVTDHGDVEAVTAPEEATVVTGEQLARATRALLEAAGR